MTGGQAFRLAEYSQLKTEQLARIGTRDNLLYATLVSYGAIVAAALNAGGGYRVLLALPPVSFIFGWTYLANDRKITAIGNYVRRLGEQIGESQPEAGQVFGWEAAHRAEPGWMRGKVMQLAVDLLAFCVSSIGALAAFWALGGSRDAALGTVSAAEAVLVGVLAWEIARWAILARDGAARS